MNAIADYAVIGDGRTAALVSRDGSIDWLCWPRPDSPWIFGALLDPRAGAWNLRPSGPFRSTRRYLDRTNVLETRFVTPGGVARVTDLMPVAAEDVKARRLTPEFELLRYIECDEGEMEFESLLDLRPGTGILARLAGPKTPVQLRAGESAAFSLTLAGEGPAIFPPLEEAKRRIEESAAWWRAWSARCSYDGPARDAVVRSALVLKLLGYAPSGALIAAPTTSLPERIGGDLNWDYRYCWLRDASMTARALFGLGFLDEGDAFVSWLLHSTRLTRRNLRVLYDVFGRRPQRERILDTLEGYAGSKPVRIGNAAEDQLQLDVYGEVLDAVASFVASGGELDRDTSAMIVKFGKVVCRRWREADEGLWEPRDGRAHHTHSRLLCWVTLDRLLTLAGSGRLKGAPLSEFSRERARIRAEIEARGWNRTMGCYTGRLDGDDVDASTLLLAWYGFEEASSSRMIRTYERVKSDLGCGRGLLYRNLDAPGEGAFGIASFWGAELLGLGGSGVAEARETFDALLSTANDVGLFAEEIDPRTGAALGNFPQAFTHIGLINAALTLDRRMRGEPVPSARAEASR